MSYDQIQGIEMSLNQPQILQTSPQILQTLPKINFDALCYLSYK